MKDKINDWIESVSAKLTPKEIVWIDGSEEETTRINDQLVRDGTFTRLNEKLYPNSFWAISDPTDVARVEERTFICCRDQNDAGPTNYWMAPEKAYQRLDALMYGCMRGRTMYVIPYLMGPVGSPYSRFGIELTDSLYVVANMRIMARTGKKALDHFAKFGGTFVKGIHSIGTLDPDEKYICHFPEDETIISFNSNYGGNALLGKKCFALRIASSLAKKEGWLAEHMLILGIENPKGEKIYVAAAFPSACGKTNLAMLIPPKSYLDAGWKVTTVGDDIAWINIGKDGVWRAINPESGFFGVAPGTAMDTNPNAVKTVQAGNTIFTNTGLDTENMTPWWEGFSKEIPSRLKDWNGKEWSPESGKKCAHPNSRFTTPAAQCPSMDKEWESPEGVPISAIIFGGRRARAVPLVFEARDWQHGVFLGATMASEMTAAAAGTLGELRRDPMAMKPFIGYHVGDYFQHWLDVGKEGGPKIFHVNWFRKNSQGKFLWPGFGENMRVLEWIFDRVKGRVDAEKTPLGWAPTNINTEGLDISEEGLQELLSVKPNEWGDELKSQVEFFEEIGNKLPRALWYEHEALKKRLG